MKKIILALALLPVVSFAQVTAPSSAFDTFMWQATGGAQQTISYGTNGTPLVSPSSAVVSADGGLPKVVQSGSMVNPSGNRVPVSMLSRIPAAKVASMLMGGIGGALVLDAGVALYDMAKERGFTLTKSPGGAVTVIKDGVAGTAYGPAMNSTVNYSSLDAMCQAYIPTLNQYYMPYTCTYSSTYINFMSTKYGGSPVTTQRYYSWAAGVGPATPSTMTALEADIAAQSGWPSGSKVSQALVDAAAITGTKIEPDVGTVTGPATSVGKVTTTNNTTNNTTKTETVTHNHTYEGNKINTTTTTVINVVDNSTGATVSNETTTSTPEPLPEPAQDVCEKNPESIGCSKYGNPVAQDQLVEETVAVTVTPVAFAGGASCPGPVSFNVAGHQYAVEYTPLCEKLSVLKFLFLAMAGFIAAYVVASMFKV